MNKTNSQHDWAQQASSRMIGDSARVYGHGGPAVTLAEGWVHGCEIY